MSTARPCVNRFVSLTHGTLRRTQANGSGITQTKFLPVTFRLPKIQGTKKKKKQASTQAREQKKHASKNSAVGKELNISYREYLAGQFENGDLFDNVRDAL